MFKPEGYGSVSPYVITQHASRVIDFMVEGLGAERLRRFDGPDGRVVHAEVRIDDSVVMIGGATAEWTAAPMHIHVYVPDVDAVFRRAVEAGGEVVQEPKQQEGDPDRRGGVKDPGGTTWWLSTQQSG